MTPNFARKIQCVLFWNSRNFPGNLALRGYHPLWHCFPAGFKFIVRKYQDPNSTSPSGYPEGFGLSCAAFGRP